MLGWAMEDLRWARPPLILGIVLGGILERYMFISIERYGVSWMLRPIVIVMFALSILTLTRPVLQDIREHHGIKAMLSNFGAPRLTAQNLFPAALLCLFIVMLAQSTHWSFEAKIIPSIVGTVALITCGLSLANDIFSKEHGAGIVALADKAKAVVTQKIHMDIASKTGHLSGDVILIRGFVFFGWMVAFLCSLQPLVLFRPGPSSCTPLLRWKGLRRCINAS